MGSNSNLPPSLRLKHLWPLADRIEHKVSDGSGPCPACADCPMHPIYYADQHDPQLYSDSLMTQPVDHLWPCQACRHQPNRVRAIVVEYVAQDAPDAA